jgi:TatD DNase family protein
MAAPLYDAHAHFAAPALRQHWQQISDDLEEIDLRYAVVNGTSPTDWPAVLELAKSESRMIPAIGLHPWQVNDAPADWQAQFLNALDRGARVIGEVGLDQWREGYDLERQQAAFRWQFAQATQRNLPVSIHCLKAIGPLMETLRREPLPKRGFHLHAYNGSVELIPELVELGAYFSFNAGQLTTGKSKALERICAVPAERLLIETDAPDMLPPPELRSFNLPESASGQALTHPATLIDGYTSIAEIRVTPLESLRQQVASNFATYFLS